MQAPNHAPPYPLGGLPRRRTATVAWGARSDRVNTSLYVSAVDCSSREPLWLMAQSVPSAALVPCVQNLPAGWRVADVHVQDGSSRIAFDSDRAGKQVVVVELTGSCDLAGAVEATPERPGVRRYLRSEPTSPRSSATRFSAFAGGCVTEPSGSPHRRHARRNCSTRDPLRSGSPPARSSDRRSTSARAVGSNGYERDTREGSTRQTLAAAARA